MKIGFGEFRNQIQTLFFVSFDSVFLRNFGLFDFNIVFFGQIPYGFRIGEMLVFHQESHHTTAFSGTEIFPNLLHGRHHKRRRALIGKRTQPFKITARTLELNEIANDFLYSSGFKNFVYGFAGNQNRLLDC